MARRPAKAMGDFESAGIRGAPLEPLRYVERELTRPDGSKLRVKVPVYPPFRLEDRPPKPSGADARKGPGKERKAS